MKHICYLCTVNNDESDLYIMKQNELNRCLRKAGCYLTGHGARHDVWYSPITGKTVRIPRHGTQEVSPGLLGTIKRELLGI